MPHPSGKPLSDLTHAVLKQAARAAAQQLARGRTPDLSAWAESLAAEAEKIIAVWFRHGQRRTARQILATIRPAKSLTRRKALPAGMSFGFDVFNPNVVHSIKLAAFQFAESTLATAAEDAAKAVAKLRSTLAKEMQRGATTQEINQAVFRIFGDPYRAARVGQTEAMRAQASGNQMAAVEGGVTHKRLILSSDACEICQAVGRKGELPIGQPYMIWPKAPPAYRIVMHPPIHPHCMCSEGYIYGPVANVSQDRIDRLRVLAYNPQQAIATQGRGTRLAASLTRMR